VIGYPFLVLSTRAAAYALGGMGLGFAANEEKLKMMAAKAFTTLSQILFDDRDFRGWKEPEYKVFRDSSDDFITIWGMENFDPLGIHTGDLIVVAPSQSYTNHQSFILGQMALKVVLHLGIVGECNIHPHSERYFIIN